MRKLLYVLVGLIVLLIVAVFALPPLLGPSLIKPRVAEMVRDVTGRELRIDGDFSLALFPSLQLRASDVNLSNAAGMTDAEMMKLGALEVEIALLPLIGKEVIVETLILSEPVFSLEQDAEGRANWRFESATPGTAEARGEERAAGAAGPPISGLQLGEVRIEGGRVAFRDGATGQVLSASGIEVSASLPDLQGVLLVEAEATLNEQPLALEISVDSPGAAMSGQAMKLETAMTSALFSLGYSGNIQQQPVPGLDGQFDLDIGSVGQLLAWLEQPLPDGQPDPGPLKLTASFTADGQKATLEEARIDGEALQATATGSFDGSGEVKRVALQVESGVLDIDRYLPPAKEKPAAAALTEGPPPSPKEMLAGVSDEPIDLSALKQTEAEVKVALGGLKARGYEVGPVGLTVTLSGGVLAAELSEFGLYGGNVTGQLALDGAGEGLGVEAQVTIDKAGVGELAKAATPEEPPPVSGVLSGAIELTAQGVSPKALMESAKGSLALDLGGINVQDARAAALTELKLTLDLPGIKMPPSLDAELIYKSQKVEVAASLAPLGQVLAGEAFPLDVKLSSKLVKLGYAGTVQQQPVPGLDGEFDLDIGSVGQLLAWLEQPLPDGQPDPGPLKLTASFTADGQKATLEEARIKGEALQATATGSFDGSGEVKRVALQVESSVLDIDRYLPPAKEKPAAAAPTEGRPPSPKEMLAGLSDEPIDLTPFKQTEAEVKVALGGIKAQGYEVGPVGLTVTLAAGVLSAELSELGFYGGNVTGRLGLDGAGDALGVEAQVSIDKAGVGELAKAATPEGLPPVAGVLSGVLEFASRGASPRKLAEGAKGRLALDLSGVEVQDTRAGALSELKLALELPGLEAAPSLDANLVYNGEPVSLDATLAPLGQVLSGGAFPLDVKLASTHINAGYAGTAQQQPVPGLDGQFDLDIGSVGQLLAWLEQPLPEGQPDPGPLKVTARFAADGDKVALEDARIDGKALKARAVGSVDSSGALALFDADVTVEELDLDAYLPRQDGDRPVEGQPQAAAPHQGWSEEPLDLAGLRQANGAIKIKTGPVKYSGLRIERSSAALTLENGVARFTLDELALADGVATAVAVLDGSGEAAALEYEAKVDKIQAKPLLKAFAGIAWLTGLGEFEGKGTARGRSQKELVSTLNGDGRFQFLDGAIEGVDLVAILRTAGTLGTGVPTGGSPRTDFTELSGSFVITDGILENRDLKMLAPLVRLDGSGQVPLPPRTIDYRLTAELVSTLEGQGGQSADALAGLPIPIHLTGPWSNVGYQIDWKTVFEEAAKDPERLANMPGELSARAKDFGIDLPLSGVTGAGAAGLLEKATGDTGDAGGQGVIKLPGASGQEGGDLGKLLEGVPGMPPAKDEGEEAATEPAAQAPAAEEQGAKEEDGKKKSPEDAGKAIIKGLFGN